MTFHIDKSRPGSAVAGHVRPVGDFPYGRFVSETGLVSERLRIREILDGEGPSKVVR